MNKTEAIFAACDQLDDFRGFDTYHGQLKNHIWPLAEQLCGKSISYPHMCNVRNLWREERLRQEKLKEQQQTEAQQREQKAKEQRERQQAEAARLQKEKEERGEVATLAQVEFLMRNSAIVKVTTETVDSFATIADLRAAAWELYYRLGDGNFATVAQLQGALTKAEEFAKLLKAA